MMAKPTLDRILLIRLSALGDCLAAVPVFHALRKAYPHAHIAWAIQDNTAQLIQNLPGLDEMIIFPRQRWKNMKSNKIWRQEFIQFVRHIRLRKFHATVDVQSNSKSASIAWLSGAPIRIGHGYPENKEISAWFNNRKVAHPESIEHIVDRNLNLLSALDITPGEPDFTLPENKPVHKQMKRWLHENNIEYNQFALFVPFTAKPEKEWAPDRYVDFAKHLTSKNQTIIFLNAPGREQGTQSMIENIDHKNVFLAPKTNLAQLIELIRLCRFAIGGDTGPVQIAGALGKPTITLFGPTDPKRSKPYGPSHVFSLSVSAQDISQEMDKVLFCESETTSSYLNY